MAKVIMQQTGKYMWQIVSHNGKVVQGDISCKNGHEANLYVKNYVSSFLNWSYEVKPLEGEVVFEGDNQKGFKR